MAGRRVQALCDDELDIVVKRADTACLPQAGLVSKKFLASARACAFERWPAIEAELTTFLRQLVEANLVRAASMSQAYSAEEDGYFDLVAICQSSFVAASCTVVRAVNSLRDLLAERAYPIACLLRAARPLALCVTGVLFLLRNDPLPSAENWSKDLQFKEGEVISPAISKDLAQAKQEASAEFAQALPHEASLFLRYGTGPCSSTRVMVHVLAQKMGLDEVASFYDPRDQFGLYEFNAARAPDTEDPWPTRDWPDQLPC